MTNSGQQGDAGWVVDTTGSSWHSERIVTELRRYMTVADARVGEQGGEVHGLVNEPLAENCKGIREFLAGRGYAVALQRARRQVSLRAPQSAVRRATSSVS